MDSLKAKLNRVAPWRFVLFFVVLAIGGAFAIPALQWTKGALVAFDVAAVVFLVSCWPTLNYDAKRLRKAAVETDANRFSLLVLSFLLTIIIFAAVTAELAQQDALTTIDKIVVALSLGIVWFFANTVYTLHYAHLFYTADDGGKDCAGLDFPGTKEPLMADFVYFAFTLGVAVQTSDVVITSPHIRKVVTAHCVAGFFFNLGVLALTINVLAAS